MLLGWPLKKARKKLYGDGKATLTNTDDLRNVLKEHLKIDKGKLRRLPAEGLKCLKRNALVFGGRNNGGKHWMVWDARKACLRDPDGFSASIKVTSFLAVGPTIG
jgi:hypothetical protein